MIPVKNSGAERNVMRTDRDAARGLTLVEVMVGTGLLALVGAALVGLFIQNFRMSKLQSFRSQAITTSLTIVEQMRFMQYPQIETVYNAGASGSFSIQVVNPTTGTDYSTITLPVHVRDGTTINSTWTTANIVVDPDSSRPLLPMRFLLSLRRNRQTTGTKVDLFEIVLLYQYLIEGSSTGRWQTGNVRLIVPSLNSMS
jgi:type II secretory pathway pseudopilin PulG